MLYPVRELLHVSVETDLIVKPRCSIWGRGVNSGSSPVLSDKLASRELPNTLLESWWRTKTAKMRGTIAAFFLKRTLSPSRPGIFVTQVLAAIVETHDSLRWCYLTSS